MTLTMLPAHRGASAGPRSHYVRCAHFGKRRHGPRCGYAVRRIADSPEQATAKPCPRCGCRVVLR